MTTTTSHEMTTQEGAAVRTGRTQADTANLATKREFHAAYTI